MESATAVERPPESRAGAKGLKAGDRLGLERRDRRGLDRARLQPRGGARPGGGRGRAAGAGGDAGRLPAHALHRGGVLLHEPRRARLRHHLHLGHPGDGPSARLAGRLGDRRGRHHRHGQPRADRRPLLVPPVRFRRAGGVGAGGDPAGRGLDRRNDHDHHDRDPSPRGRRSSCSERRSSRWRSSRSRPSPRSTGARLLARSSRASRGSTPSRSSPSPRSTRAS